MKRSVLAKAVGASVISINLIVLPLMPVHAQSSTATNNSNINNTAQPNNAIPDANANNNPNSNANNSNAPTTSNNASVGNSSTPSNPPASNNPTSSNAPKANTPAQNTASAKSEHNSNWSGLGLLGLLGLIGLANLFRRQTARYSNSSNNNHQLEMNIHSAGDRLHEGVNQVGVETHNFWDKFKARFSDFKTHRAQEKEIKQIKNALGRPSNRVILDKQDRVILNVGDLITNQAIEQARGADMLDVLLDSVDAREPEIANEERSAPVPGEASLEKRQQETTITK